MSIKTMFESFKSQSPEISTAVNIILFFLLFGGAAFLILGAGLAIILIVDGNFNRLSRPGGILTFKLQTTLFESWPIDIDWKLPLEPRSRWARCFHRLLSGVMVFVSPISNSFMEAYHAFARDLRELAWHTDTNV
ncbi:hypothetical protein ONZ45_g13534 [Pleurotus djamor]|nr:hypothetical protein ONZ45_g13534 [Pleurotus djamor]